MFVNYQEGPLWKVVDLEGKGKGVIAKTDVPPGTLIVEEVPLFTVPKDIHENKAQVRQKSNITSSQHFVSWMTTWTNV